MLNSLMRLWHNEFKMNKEGLDQYMEQRDPENYQMDKPQQGQEIA